MSTKEPITEKPLQVVSISRTDSRFRAVEFRKDSRGLEVLWTKTGMAGQESWSEFASDCGVESVSGVVNESDSEPVRRVVAGFDSAGIVFNQIDVPVAGASEISSIVRLQAESRLPLAVDQMELAWRTGQTTNGQMKVTMAAARTDHLRRFVNDVSGISPSRIMLEADGIVESWRRLFGGTEKIAVVLSAGAKDCQVCLAENGVLANAVVLDMGTDDFLIAEGHTIATERFARDVRSVIEMFGCQDASAVAVRVLSDGGEGTEKMADALYSAGLNAGVVLPQVGQSLAGGGLSAETIYDYRVSLGLGLIAAGSRADALNIFERLYSPEKKKEKKPWFSSVKITAGIAIAGLVVYVLVSYAVDVAKPGAIDRSIAKAISDSDMRELTARQGLRDAIARQRPDMVQFVSLLNEIGPRGVKLDAISFKKGQAASVSGESPGQDQVYEFEEKLNANKYIKDAKIKNQSVDSKTRKVNFSIEFKYKNFSDKKSVK
ncbi:MAG: hypothetical protein JW720_01455 [Sedimentisphaerales bacterium]|nr:hypothetical protein [Sedimentisphaerales bacterium]